MYSWDLAPGILGGDSGWDEAEMASLAAVFVDLNTVCGPV